MPHTLPVGGLTPIVAATEADLDALVQLLAHLFTQEAEFSPDAAAQRRGLLYILHHPEVGQLLVARREGRVLGMVNLLYTFSTALGAPVAVLEDLVVDPAARGQGLGQRLLDGAIAHARRHGCKRITLLTDADNQPAQRLYRQRGFAPSPMVPMRLS